jgi:arylsulfatase A-like enzyme
VSLLTAALPLACGRGAHAPPPRFGTGEARPAPEVRLADLEARVSGEARSDGATLAAWSGASLAAWSVRAEGGRVRLLGPSLGGVRDVGAVELALAPGGATRLDLTPSLAGEEGEAARQVRRIEVSIEQNLAPGTVLQLRIDLGETLRGNWGDAAQTDALDGLELALVGADPARVRLESIRLERRDSISEPFAARRAVAERGGEFHPSWWLRGGVSVDFDLDLPAGGCELRWREAGLGGGEDLRVELLAPDASRVLAAHAADPAGWQVRRVSLADHAGRRVTLRLSNRGAGVALFGNPRVVVTPTERVAGDVIVYLIDTLRGDHVGRFGARFPDITPTIDRLIRDGVGFELALSHSPWTKPTIATLMTGLLPTTHRIGSRTLSDRLPASVDVLQGRFRQAGWRTGSFSANPLGSTLSGLERGFGTALAPRFWRSHPELGDHPSAAQLRAELLRWIDAEPDRPFFAYVHVMEVHPLGRSHLTREGPETDTPYARAVRAADADLGALLDALEARDRLERLLLVVLGDHGDSFGEHGERLAGHGTSLYQAQIHVPLVFWQQGGPQREPVRVPVGLADVAPTLLAAFALPPLAQVDGVDLSGHWSGAPGPRRPVLSALIRYPHTPGAPEQRALVTPDGHKALQIGDAPAQVFDLARDPQEIRSVPPADAAEALAELGRSSDDASARARWFRELHDDAGPGVVSARELERLKKLGYVP